MLSVNRLDRAKRIDLLIEAAKLDPSLRIVIAGEGPDRARLEQLASGLNGRIDFTGRVDDERLADLYARCLAVFYAPVDEDYGMVPYEAFLSEKPVVTTIDAGGPLEIVHDRETGVVVAPEAAAVARACAYLAGAPRRGEGLGRGREGGRRARDLGRLHRRAPLVKVAYFSPLPPSRSGISDYSALLLPALERAGRGGRGRAAGQGARRAADVSLYHVGNDPDSHGWIVDALREQRPGVVVLHEIVLHHLISGITIGRGDGRGYLDAMERELGVAGRLLGLGVLDNLLPLLWETQPERFPLTGTVLDLADGLIVHSRYVEARRARRGLRRPGLARSRTRPGPSEPVAPADVDGRPARRLLRLPEHEQADPAAARGVRAAAGAAGRARGCCSPARPPSASTSSAGSSGSASAARRSIREDYVPEERAVVADGGVRRARQPALADDGRDLGRGDPRRSRSARRCSCPTSAGSPSCRTASR